MGAMGAGQAAGQRTPGHLESVSLWLGCALYLASFFLPAVATVRPSEEFQGWQSAVFYFVSSFRRPLRADLPTLFDVLLVPLIALINPLTLIYLLLRILRRGEPARQRIAVAAMAFAALTWIFLALHWIAPPEQRLNLEIGFAVWMAGLVLLMVPDAVRFFIAPAFAPHRGRRAEDRWVVHR